MYVFLMIPEAFHMQGCLSSLIVRMTTKTPTTRKMIFIHLLGMKLLGNNILQIKQNGNSSHSCGIYYCLRV